MEPHISVIIPSSRAEMVGETIACLDRQDMDGNAFEIVVVCPEGPDYALAENTHARVCRVDRLHSPGRMRNIGASVAKGSLLAFIDDDCLPPANWLSSAEQVLLADVRCAAVGCRVVGSEKSYWSHCADYALFAAYQFFMRKETPLGSAAILVRRTAFESVGGFDEHLLASEDWDFSLKLIGEDWRCWFNPHIEVAHNHGCTSPAKIVSKAYLYGKRSKLTVQKRHKTQMSILAQLSLRMQSPWLYGALILPYALLVSIVQSVGFFRSDKRLVIYFPIIVLARIFYHCGVLRGLAEETTRNHAP